MNNKLWEKSYPKQLKNYQLDESLLSGSVSEFCLYAAQHFKTNQHLAWFYLMVLAKV